MANITRSSVLVVSPDQISADISSDSSGDVVILQLKDGIYYQLNETGAHVWNLIQQPSSFEAILESLHSDYDVEKQQCEADLMTLVQELLGHGLIEIKDETNS